MIRKIVLSPLVGTMKAVSFFASSSVRFISLSHFWLLSLYRTIIIIFIFILLMKWNVFTWFVQFAFITMGTNTKMKSVMSRLFKNIKWPFLFFHFLYLSHTRLTPAYRFHYLFIATCRYPTSNFEQLSFPIIKLSITFSICTIGGFVWRRNTPGQRERGAWGAGQKERAREIEKKINIFPHHFTHSKCVSLKKKVLYSIYLSIFTYLIGIESLLVRATHI